jgi:hypothetical protein
VLNASVVSDDPAANLQLGLAIELSVLPPYLYALWSIKGASEGASQAAIQAADSIRAVAFEEMLHAALVANILGAIGAMPEVHGHLMTYPGELPGHVTEGPYHYTVGLGPLSADAIKTFKLIERPPWIPVEQLAPTGWITIHDFYESVRKQLKARPEASFRGGHQVPAGDNPGPGRMIEVDSLETALIAIAIVLDQGEGHKPKAPNDPPDLIDDDHEMAHYEQFAMIGSYFDSNLIEAERDLYPVAADPDPSTYSDAQRAADNAFNAAYTDLLDSLQRVWTDARPSIFGEPTDHMRRLEHLAAELRALGPVPGGSSVAGPTFRYLVGRGGGGY